MVAERLKGIEGISPSELPESYYDLGSYVSKERMITFWYQLQEVLACRPSSVLEVGVGSRIVSGALRERGIGVTTIDINSALRPTVVGRVQDLSEYFEENSFDVILCARVLHHVPFDEFDHCLRQLADSSGSHVVLTLPADDLRLYLSLRITSKRSQSFTLALPRRLKQLLLKQSGLSRTHYSKLWKIGTSDATALPRIHELLQQYFVIEKSFPLLEDHSHHLFVLRKCLRRQGDNIL